MEQGKCGKFPACCGCQPAPNAESASSEVSVGQAVFAQRGYTKTRSNVVNQTLCLEGGKVETSERDEKELSHPFNPTLLRLGPTRQDIAP